MRNAVLLTVVATALHCAVSARAAEDFDYTIASSKSVDAAVDAITSAAQADGFKVPGVHTLPAGVDCVIVELCDPVEARKVLAVDMKIALLLPCGRIAVYADPKHGGRTKVSMLLPSTSSKLYPGKVVADMARGLDPRMRKIVHAAQ